MCGRFRVTQDWSEIERRFGAKLSQRVLEQHEVRYNVAPTDPVIRQREGCREAGYLRWGLVPHWPEGPKSTASMINAKGRRSPRSRRSGRCSRRSGA